MLFLDNGKTYDTALSRLCVQESDSWKGISPSTDGADFNPEPPIFTAKFANCSNYAHILAIANEDGKVLTIHYNLIKCLMVIFNVLFTDCFTRYKFKKHFARK